MSIHSSLAIKMWSAKKIIDKSSSILEHLQINSTDYAFTNGQNFIFFNCPSMVYFMSGTQAISWHWQNPLRYTFTVLYNMILSIYVWYDAHRINILYNCAIFDHFDLSYRSQSSGANGIPHSCECHYRLTNRILNKFTIFEISCTPFVGM